MGRVSHALYHLDGIEVWKLTAQETRRHKQKILGWDYGWDLFHLFDPVKIPIDDGLMASAAFHVYWKAQLALRRWAWNAIYRSVTQRRPPAKLWRAESHARKAFHEFQAMVQRAGDLAAG
jgi:hypothetical protein